MSGDWATWRAASAHKSSGAWTPPYSLLWTSEDPEDHSHTVAEGSVSSPEGRRGAADRFSPRSGHYGEPGEGGNPACSEQLAARSRVAPSGPSGHLPLRGRRRRVPSAPCPTPSPP